jgi:hypothetical protein
VSKAVCVSCYTDNGEPLVEVDGRFYHRYHRPKPVNNAEQRRQQLQRPAGLAAIKIQAIAQSHYREGAD